MTRPALSIRLGTAVQPEYRDDVPYCSTRCVHLSATRECELHPGQVMDATRACLPTVASWATQLSMWRDRAVAQMAAKSYPNLRAC